MKTPIYDFLRKYSESGSVRMHMPGHKGLGVLGCESLDITEISGADVLYSADGIIEESENNLTSLYGTEHSFYSTEGSTLSIKAMLAIAVSGRSKKVLAARNAHKAFIYAAAMLDLEVDWLYPSEGAHLCACPITPSEVERALSRGGFSAVYLTTPDYLGNIADVKGIAEVCKTFGVPLLVDNAHGAYLKFLPEDIHPITLGAAMCADSAHKTLPALTGGAYLHVSRDFPAFAKKARNYLSMFASTSPSYLTLCSLDLCNKTLAEGYCERIARTVDIVENTRLELSSLGFIIRKSEPLKIVIDATGSGISGVCLSHLLREFGIEVEFADADLTVLMITPSSTDEDMARVICAMTEISARRGEGSEARLIPPTIHETKMSIRDAVFSDFEEIDVSEAVGRICASPTVSCPPAVPIVVSGEVITADDVATFRYYGIETVAVVSDANP